MFYPYREKQTFRQWILNTIDWRMWQSEARCECCWQVFQGKLMWVPLAGCPYHD